MPSSHLILCCPFLLLAPITPSIRVFSNECSGLISFKIDWFDLLAVQGTLWSLLQHHSLKASILWHSTFFMVQLREGNGNPLQYSCLENPMGGGAWKAAVHGGAEGQTQLSNFTFTFHFHVLEKEMAAHSSVLAWRIPGTGEPGGLPSMGSHRVGHD